jgi:hypothetical protein
MTARERFLSGIGLGFVIVAAACTGPVLPLSAQKGSTIVIPLTGASAEERGEIGYGGTQVTDYQRGSLIYKLDGPSGPELVTRGSSFVLPSLASPIGYAGYNYVSGQIVSIVDIPNTAAITTGTHSLYVVRRFQGVDEPLAYPYPGQIAILPASIDVGGGVVVSGQSTPFSVAFEGSSVFTAIGPTVNSTVPKPQLKATFGASVYAAEVQLAYPTAVINVRDVTEAVWSFQGISHRAITWWSEPSPGVLSISMLSSNPLRGVSVVFDLDDGANQILDPAQVTVQSVRGWNANGSPVATTLGALAIY